MRLTSNCFPYATTSQGVGPCTRASRITPNATTTSEYRRRPPRSTDNPSPTVAHPEREVLQAVEPVRFSVVVRLNGAGPGGERPRPPAGGAEFRGAGRPRPRRPGHLCRELHHQQVGHADRRRLRADPGRRRSHRARAGGAASGRHPDFHHRGPRRDHRRLPLQRCAKPERRRRLDHRRQQSDHHAEHSFDGFALDAVSTLFDRTFRYASTTWSSVTRARTTSR